MATILGPDLHKVQRIRKAVLLAGLVGAVGLAFVTQSFGGETIVHEGLEDVGLGLIVLCIVGRAWCSLYIGGRKKAEIVDRGPYSISRNPLYVFSFLGAFGMGAMSGSILLASLFLVIAILVFRSTVKREEVWLEREFGAPYRAYLARAPRFWPDFSKWSDRETLEIRPVFFLLTLRDGLVMLLAFPLFEWIEALQAAGWLTTVLQLP